MNFPDTCLEAALLHRSWGWSVVPIEPRGKKPLVKWAEFQKRLPEPDEIRTWFDRWPDANVAIATGAVSGLIVLDVDSQAGLDEIEARGPIEGAPTALTAKGMHFYLAHPGEPVRNFAKRIEGLDLRGDGGYVLAPPSIHPSGVIYTWHALPGIEEL